MSITQRRDEISRDAILKLLSDEEAAKVSTAETAPALEEGSEYLDLQNLGASVQIATKQTHVAMGHVLCRRSVSEATWSKILGHLEHELASTR